MKVVIWVAVQNDSFFHNAAYDGPFLSLQQAERHCTVARANRPHKVSVVVEDVKDALSRINSDHQLGIPARKKLSDTVKLMSLTKRTVQEEVRRRGGVALAEAA